MITAIQVLKWIFIIVYVVLPFIFFTVFRMTEIQSLYYYFSSTLAVNSWHNELTIVTTVIAIMISIIVWIGVQRRSMILLMLLLLTAAFRYIADVSSSVLWDPKLLLKSDATDLASSLAGTVALVTGANKGIGLMTAKMLAELGAHVIVTCRTVERCHDAVQEIDQAAKDSQSGGFAQAMSLDLDSLQSVYDLVQTLKSDSQVAKKGIHLLFNNAGTNPFGRTVEGLESGFGGIHLAHMALTLGVLPLLEKSAQNQEHGVVYPARVVMVSSEAITFAIDNMFGETFTPSFMEHDGEGDLRGEITLGAENLPLSSENMRAYGRAKLCNVLFAFELNRRMHNKAKYTSSSPPVIAHALNPGAASTSTTQKVSSSPFVAIPGLSFLVKHVYLPLYCRSPRSAARVLLFAGLAKQPDVMTRGGCYINELGKPIVSSLDQNATVPKYETLLMADHKYSARLWEVSLQLIRKSPAKSFARNAP